MIKGFEKIKKKFSLWKKRKEDFFVRMENYKISFFTSCGIFSYIMMLVCALAVMTVFAISEIKNEFNTASIIIASIFIVLTLIAMISYVVSIFLKNSLQFKLGKISSGLISFAILVVPIYFVLLLCYINIPQGREIIVSLFTAVTTFSATILTIMGVHYTLVQQRNERIDKNNLIFELYDNSDKESEYKVKSALGDMKLNLKIKNISNNFGYIIGLFKLCGCDIYQIGDDFSYLAIQPNHCLSITDIQVNTGDDQLILVYKDIGENYYYLLISIYENKICNIERFGKCDIEFLYNQIIETNETEKAVSSENKKEKVSKIDICQEEDINKRKEETKPNNTENVDGFEVVVSVDGEIKTDIKLLNILKKERLRLAKEKRIKAYMIFNNQQLVALATYKPKDENSFISIYGLGQKKYDFYGELFIHIIISYEELKGAA